MAGWGRGGFFYERRLRVFQKLRAFAKAKPQGTEAEINRRLDPHDPYIEEAKAARWWGLRSMDEWRELPELTRAESLAVWREVQLREAHAAKVSRDVIEEEGKKKNKPQGKGTDPYAAFFGGVGAG